MAGSTRNLPRPRQARAALPEPPDEPMRVDFLDLDGRKVERIELEGGGPLGQPVPSAHQRAAAIVAAVYDVDFDLVQPLSIRQLAKYVIVDSQLEVVDGGQDDDPGNG